MRTTKKKILVVDDTEATRYAIARTLKSEGYDIVEASNGSEALTLSLSEKPDLITLDIHLPDIMGFEVCRRIKANPQTEDIPVLQVSASFVTSKDRIHGLEGGADSYLTHPFEPPVLIATVKALLRGRSLNENLRFAEEKFRVALKYAPIMIYTTDTRLRYTWMYNPPTGSKVTDYLGKTDAELYRPEEAHRIGVLKRDVLSSGTGTRMTCPMTRDRVTCYYDMTIEPLRGDAHEIIGLTVACIDVTERLRSEEAQRRALAEAEIANQAKTRFLSNMSHEIRTPLGVIQGFADLALESSVSASDREDYLQTIKRNATNLTKLLGEILDLAKVEAGKIEMEKTRFSLPELTEELMNALSIHALDKGIQLKCRIDGAIPNIVETDPTLLRQILMNLVGNALKFTAKGGVEVILSAKPRLDETAPVFIDIAVKDTGVGLTPEQQGRLFQPFVQADSSTTRKYGGTGLGLNLSKKLAQLLGGDLVLSESRPEEGSTFTLTFEAGVAAQGDFVTSTRRRAEKEEAPSVASRELEGMRVLLAEDSNDNQILFSRYLRNAGATVSLANDGVEAVEKYRDGEFDAVLMDVQMPNLDGYDATKALREKGSRTPIVALTAHALKEERERALSQGFSDYLTKPLNPKLLVETLRRFRSAETAD